MAFSQEDEMEYRIRIDAGLPYLLIELTGDFDVRALEKCYREFLSHPSWKTGMDILWDCRRCSLVSLAESDMRIIGKMTEKYRDARGAGKAAWVVGKDVDFGLSRMFEIINEEKVVFQFRVFRSLAQARDWIASE
jgi:hypothetical protein